MPTHHDHDHDHDQDDTKPIHTQAGTSNAIVGDGEKLTGKMGPDDTEEASDFYEEIGAAIEGKEGDDVHNPDMRDEDE